MNILLTAPFAPDEISRLERFGDVTYRPWKANGREHAPEQLRSMLLETGANALIVEHDVVDSSVLEAVPLEFIGVCRGTPSNVDVAAATRLGIPVFHTPARNAQAVAEYVVCETIAMLRKAEAGKAWLKQRQWTDSSHESYLQFRGREIAGKTIGFVGLGGVGRRLAGLLKHFGCRIQYFDPYLKASPDPEYVAVDVESLFASSDVVSVHLPVTPETTGMIDERLFRLMKPEAIFVNSARAAVVERESLYRALSNGTIGGAVLDVFYSEPPDANDYEIIDLRNVSATPHIAGNTAEVDRYHADMMLSALEQWTSKPKSAELLYNPEVLADASA